jgi:hypothetical protein
MWIKPIDFEHDEARNTGFNRHAAPAPLSFAAWSPIISG